MLVNILLGIATISTFFSYLPQTIKILRNKTASDLSISSWILGVISSLSYFLYAILCSNEFMLKVVATTEFIFCLLILVLTIIYRKPSVGNRLRIFIRNKFNK